MTTSEFSGNVKIDIHSLYGLIERISWLLKVGPLSFFTSKCVVLEWVFARLPKTLLDHFEQWLAHTYNIPMSFKLSWNVRWIVPIPKILLKGVPLFIFLLKEGRHLLGNMIQSTHLDKVAQCTVTFGIALFKLHNYVGFGTTLITSSRWNCLSSLYIYLN